MGIVETVLGSAVPTGGPAEGGNCARRDSCSSMSTFSFPSFSSSFPSFSMYSPPAFTPSTFFLHFLALHLFWILTSSNSYTVMGAGGTECMKRKYYEITVSYFGGLSINRTVKCDMYFQWTVQDFCCYDKYDRFERNPFCCYSETYKLVLAVGFICLVLLASSFSIFCCWLYNLPHHLLYLITCGKFHLNDWMVRNKSGPYVDPTFYSGEPFWARGAEMQPYPLRPMPPKIFYPAPPPKLKYRWDINNGEIPLFVIASRQFTRNPYSARPQDRQAPTANSGQFFPSAHSGNGGLFSSSESRRNSLSSNHNTGGVTTSDCTTSTQNHQTTQQQRQTGSAQNSNGSRRNSSALYPSYRNSSQPQIREPPPFQVNIDEVEAAQELYEALKMLEERGDKTAQEWNALMESTGGAYSPDYEDGSCGGASGQSYGSGSSSNGVFAISDGGAGANTAGGSNPFGRGVRPNTTGGGGSLDQYGNYVSLTANQTLTKPNTDILNQQLSTLGMPIYSMPGVHTAGVVSTVQNYHVVSSNLGNPMETILEDDSLDDMDDIIAADRKEAEKAEETKSTQAKGKVVSKTDIRKPILKRRASTITENTTLSRVGSALDHVVGPTPTTRATVPFMPTLPGSMVPDGPLDTRYIDTVVRRNSVI